MADRSVIELMREAIKNAETGSAFITKAPVLGSSLETLLFSTSKGNKVLCAIGVETSLAVSGGTVTAVAAKQGQMIDDFFLKIDNQLRVKSNEATVLLELADLVMDKVQTDAVLTAAGTAHSYHLIPVSGVGGRQAQLDIDFATFAAMYSAGTEGAKSITITPYYTDMPIPVWSLITGGTPSTGTGAYKLQISGDFVGNGFLESGILIGDGTIVGDDLRIIQEDAKLLLNQKCYLRDATGTRPLEEYWQALFQKTVLANSAGFRVNSSLPWSINSVIELDVGTTGTFKYGLIFKNSPTSTNESVQGQPPTPRPEPRIQPIAPPTTGQNTRLVGSNTGPNIGGNVRRLFGL